MYIFDIENKSSLKELLLENLKTLGVRCRHPKKIKENEKENIYSDHQVFQKPISLLKKCSTCRLNGSNVDVPEFLVDACSVIEKNLETEGIFRKAGSVCVQREAKSKLNKGKKIGYEYHVLDACCLVKLFFRELPHPIIPYAYHGIFLKCLLLSTYEKELDALLLACLLIPEENLATLAFFMECLLKVSWHADKNKMNARNLATVLTPTLMPVSKVTSGSHLEIAHHFKVIEMLIENAERIGEVPEKILEALAKINDKKSKKKKYGGPKRMINGLKKIVRRSSAMSELDDFVDLTPDSLPSVRKRKSNDTDCRLSSPAKKKHLCDSPPTVTLTPLRCRMHGYASSFLSLQSPVLSNIKRTYSCGSGEKILQKDLAEVEIGERKRATHRPSRLVRRCTTIKQKPKSNLFSSNSTENVFNIEAEKSSLERAWVRKKSFGSQSNSPVNKPEAKSTEEPSENVADTSDSEFITVHKTEFENIKNRVSALEEEFEKLEAVHSVQSVYEKTLEESEKLDDGSTEHLARKLSRELKIRRSSENQVIRSPSARKIGSIRRRSKESNQKSAERRSSLKRGRPNTVQTGLPSPRLRSFSNENIPSPVKFATPQKEEWKSGEIFFAKDHMLQRLTPAPHDRPSIAKIRCQNAGMVLEKAKLFNSLNESTEGVGRNGSGNKVARRQSVRVENSRCAKDSRKTLSRTKSLMDSKQKAALESGQDFKTVTFDVCTPKSQKSYENRKETPHIKKALITRSPRSLAKTPLNHVRSVNRSRATPMKALIEANGTPHIGLRRSPRILTRTMNAISKVRD